MEQEGRLPPRERGGVLGVSLASPLTLTLDPGHQRLGEGEASETEP